MNMAFNDHRRITAACDLNPIGRAETGTCDPEAKEDPAPIEGRFCQPDRYRNVEWPDRQPK
jgi:hypothetical protein